MTRLYHGSPKFFQTENCRLNLDYANRNMDFGRGAYLSYDPYDVINYVKRKYRHGFLYEYHINMEQAKRNLSVREFSSASVDWLDFVIQNRLDLCQNTYDIVIGPTADGPVVSDILEIESFYYLLPIQSKVALIQRWKPRRFAAQVCILTENANDCLIFKGRRVIQ